MKAVRRNVRLRKVTAAAALEAVGPDAKPKLVRWLKGRVAWAMGRKRTGA